MAQEHQHIAILHTELSQKGDDHYLIDAALALEKSGHQVTIYTSSCKEFNSWNALNSIRRKLRIVSSGSWIPKTVFGKFKELMQKLKSVWMAFSITVYPPIPQPKSLILDTNAIALFILSCFGEYDTIYINHCPQLQKCEFFQDVLSINSDLLTEKALGYANQIIVQTESLYKIFVRSFPDICKKTTVLYPTCNIDLWAENIIDIVTLLPDIPEDHALFVAFGSYVRRSNFSLILKALDCLYITTNNPLRNKIHIVIAGNCDEGSDEQERHYKSLIHNVILQPYASQITFFKKVTPTLKKSLIYACAAVLHPVVDDLYPGPVLTAMKMSRPLIAVNGGFITEILVDNFSAMLVEPTPFDFAKMIQLITLKPTLGRFIGMMARENYERLYSFDIFASKINNLILNKEVVPYKSAIAL